MPGIPERVAAIETRCVEREKAITKLSASVDSLENTVSTLNGTIRIALFKMHMIWLGAAAAFNIASLFIVTRILGK